MSRLARIILLVTIVSACGGEHAQGEGSAFDRATAAAASAKSKEAAKLFAEAARTDRDPRVRDEAELRLANIEWRVMRKHSVARGRLQRLAAGEHERFQARVELARIAHDLGDAVTARREAREAMRVGKTQRERDRGALTLAFVVVHGTKRDADETREVINAMRELIARQGPIREATTLLLESALLAGDGAAAMEAIDGYYHVSPFAGPPSAIAAAHAELRKILPSWRGTDAEREPLARALAGARFFKQAFTVAPAAATDVAAYGRAVRRIEALTNEYYRELALDDESHRAFRKALDRELRTVWRVLSNQKYDRKKAEEELARRFGAYILLGETQGFKDLHYGHVVSDQTLRVQQYGRTAAVRLVVLDSMVSNGIGTWLTDGRGGDGGWATATTIYQVRPMYADGPLRAYQRMFDAEVAAEEDRELSEESAKDRERAAAQPIRTFPGLLKRLERQYFESVVAELRRRGLEGEALRDAFLARLESDTHTFSIELHEGRHAIDKVSKQQFKTWELEYRAKLSEIGLSAAPRAALHSVLDNTIGGDSPHGKANEELVKGLVAWMEANRAFIPDLDPTLPMMPQLDKLTDEQIRQAVRSVDPLAADG